MSFFSFGKQKDHIELICDIGSGSVAVSFVKYETDKDPIILSTERHSFPAVRTRTAEGLASALSKGLHEMLVKQIRYASLKQIHVNHVSCFYSSPWFISQTKIFKLKQAKPITFSQAILDKILKQNENFFAHLKANSPLFDAQNIKPIERRVTRVTLNGYETHNPFGKKASFAEVSVFVSALSAQIFSAVEENIKRSFVGVSIEHHTFPLASFTVLRNIFHSSVDFIMLDISGEVTDISLVRDNTLSDTMSFPMGKRNIIRRIEDACGFDYSIAESALSMYLKNELHGDENTKLLKVSDEVTKDWLTHFERSIDELTSGGKIPSILYFVSDENMLPFFENSLHSEKHAQYADTFQTVPLKSDMLDSLVIQTASARKDFFIALEALYIHTLRGSSVRTLSNYVVE